MTFSAEQRVRIIADYIASGQTQTAFCYALERTTGMKLSARTRAMRSPRVLAVGSG